jgi:hypothetical protein
MTDMNKKFTQDEELSDFADRVLKGQMKHSASNSDEEMRGLEETILRLHNNMPSPSLEESTKKQMLVRLNARIRREKAQPQKMSFLASLFNTPRPQPKFALAIGILAILITAVILSPTLGIGDPSTTIGTAFNSNSSIFIVLGLVVVVIGVLWSVRRK